MSAPSGVLVVAKPAGRTSFDVVAAVRRALRVRRAGHAGTLDPDAVGVLPILVGEATKLMGYLADQDKEYRVTMRFGVVTDTLDAGGRVLETRPVPPLTREVVERAARAFVGAIRQVPPMYSARHHEGRRLYELARQGVEVPREARDVVVYSIGVDEVAFDRATLTVVCGKGTYVRVIVADLGTALGPGASVEQLVRTRVGPFALAEAVSWEAVSAGPPEALWARVRPPESALERWPAVHLGLDAERAFVSGQSVSVTGARGGSGFVRVHAADGILLGVGELTAAGTRVRPVRVLHVDRPRTRVLPA
ncbi:MAG: tRNA pseudouridine(55) synthase TruB [Candidatus Rokubacteria bacterium]|nr:tRNA pseudouridine(55) synthase TruB [Candidatus Rokubacteria bacterium]